MLPNLAFFWQKISSATAASMILLGAPVQASISEPVPVYAKREEEDKPKVKQLVYQPSSNSLEVQLAGHSSHSSHSSHASHYSGSTYDPYPSPAPTPPTDTPKTPTTPSSPTTPVPIAPSPAEPVIKKLTNAQLVKLARVKRLWPKAVAVMKKTGGFCYKEGKLVRLISVEKGYEFKPTSFRGESIVFILSPETGESCEVKASDTNLGELVDETELSKAQEDPESEPAKTP